MSWDKDKPAGSQKVRLADDDIRANNAALEDALYRNHVFPGVEGSTAGRHNAIDCVDQVTDPTNITAIVTLYNKGGELFVQDASGNVVQITDGGVIADVPYATDAGTLDTLDSLQFLRSDVADVKTAGDLTFNDSVKILLGTGADAELYCNGSHAYLDLGAGIGNFYIRDGTTTRYTFDDDGTFTATGDVVWSSDRRKKDNLEIIPDALGKVGQINGYTFDRIDMDNVRRTGLIAQEVEKVMPEAVQEDSDGMLTVAYGSLIGLAFQAIKELQAEVARLQTRGR